MLEIRTGTLRADAGKLGGYAAVYNAPSKPLTIRGLNNGKPFVERIAPGAFDGIEGKNVSLLVGHDRSQLLANSASGLLTLRSDSTGLAYEVTLPDTQRARDVRALVEAGVMTEMSFGFYVKSDAWNGDERTLRSVALQEISIIEANGAAYPQTSAEARNTSTGAARLRLRLRSV
jgi:HK97 family phage prohead protease